MADSDTTDQPADSPDTTNSTPPQPAPADGNPAKAAFDLKQSVAEKIAEGSANIRAQVVEELAKEELVKRKDLVLKAVKRRGELDGEIQKMLRPTEKKFRVVKDEKNNPVRQGDGSIKTEQVETYLDGAAHEDLKKKQAELLKIDKAIAAAFAATPDYKLLKDAKLG